MRGRWPRVRVCVHGCVWWRVWLCDGPLVSAWVWWPVCVCVCVCVCVLAVHARVRGCGGPCVCVCACVLAQQGACSVTITLSVPRAPSRAQWSECEQV